MHRILVILTEHIHDRYNKNVHRDIQFVCGLSRRGICMHVICTGFVLLWASCMHVICTGFVLLWASCMNVICTGFVLLWAKQLSGLVRGYT